jgi:hypothetical protein
MKDKGIIFSFLLVLTFSVSYGQFDFSTIPKYDCDNAKLNEFESGKNYIFIIPDKFDTLLNDRVERWLDWYPLSLRIKAKKESELKPKDYKKKIWIAGQISDFKHFEKFELPIKLTNNGFQFDSILLEDKRDAIMLMLENKIVMIGNSSKATSLLYNNYLYGYDFVISQNNRLSYFGKLDNDYSIKQIANVNDIKNQNYSSAEFSGGKVYISKTLEDTIGLNKGINDLKFFISEYCSTMQIPIPDYKFPMYIHSNQEEISTVSTFWDACGGHIYGLQKYDEIHVEKLNFGTFRHEIQHLIFNSLLNDNQPSFFSEGIVEYYFNLKNDERLRKRIEISKQEIKVPNKKLIIGKRNFFGAEKVNGIHLHYGVSGIFTKYMIDKWGLDKYKEFYSYKNTDEGLSKTYDLTLNQLINGYRKWIKEYKL